MTRRRPARCPSCSYDWHTDACAAQLAWLHEGHTVTARARCACGHPQTLTVTTYGDRSARVTVAPYDPAAHATLPDLDGDFDLDQEEP